MLSPLCLCSVRHFLSQYKDKRATMCIVDPVPINPSGSRVFQFVSRKLVANYVGRGAQLHLEEGRYFSREEHQDR